jgi:Flp pilus assembly protein TadD
MENRANLRRVAGIALLLACAAPCVAQTVKPNPPKRQHVEQQSTADLTQAEDALSRHDFATAEPLLKQATEKFPNDYRAWYDLGYLYNATGRRSEAIEAYRKSVAAKPDQFESNFRLGLMLAAAGDADAATFLNIATHLKPEQNAPQNLAEAWLALGRIVEKNDAQQALNAFREAVKQDPANADAHIEAAKLLQSQGDLPGAEQEYSTATKIDPKSQAALAGLVNVYVAQKRLPEAESALRRYLQAEPNNAAAHRDLARVLQAEGKHDEALAEFKAAGEVAPGDPKSQSELAASAAAAGNWDEAARLYRAAVQQAPNDPDLHYALGTALLNQHNYEAAQQEFVAAIKLKPNMTDAYGNLAVAANEAKNYELAIRAVDARAKLAGDNPGTYFLRATAYDHLRDYKQAAANYRQFLSVSDGKNPDQEWQARHRLIAIDPQKKK